MAVWWVDEQRGVWGRVQCVGRVVRISVGGQVQILFVICVCQAILRGLLCWRRRRSRLAIWPGVGFGGRLVIPATYRQVRSAFERGQGW
jgi:hypothetical protein